MTESTVAAGPVSQLFDAVARDELKARWGLASARVARFNGITPAAQPLVVAALHQLFPTRTIVVVTDGTKAQEIFHTDLQTWLGAANGLTATEGVKHPPDIAARLQPETERALFYPAWETLPHEKKLPPVDVVSERLETLVTLGTPRPSGAVAPIVVTQVTALLQKTFTPEDLRNRTRTLKVGDTCNPLDLIEWLEDQGYEPEAQVSNKGELAWRGGIIDLWSLSSPWPVRLEFFGDEVDSLREFDPRQQTSREPVTSVVIPPAGELNLLRRGRFDGRASNEPATSPDTPVTGSTPASLPLNLSLSAGGPPAPELGLATFLDHLSPDALLVLCGAEELELRALNYRQQVPANDPFFVAWDELLAQADARPLGRVELTDSTAEFEIEDWVIAPGSNGESTPEDIGGNRSSPICPAMVSLEAYRPIAATLPEAPIAEAQRRAFFEQLHRWWRSGHTVWVFCNTVGERQRFGELWQEYGLGALPEGKKRGLEVGDLRLGLGSLSRGFLVESAKLVVVTDAEIYGRYKISRPRRMKSAHANAVRSAFEVDFTEFEVGDYVVHLQHGIALYRGLQTLEAKGRNGTAEAGGRGSGQECLALEFAVREPGAEPPRLYVPVTEAHLVSKYVGAGKARPQLSSLGGTRWSKAKQETQLAVRDLAAELLAVQAARQTEVGHAFSADTPWQREFEAAFEFEETVDQLREIVAVKRDMETAKPMDRLLCGDVGFGKTEVALRAAFKAVMSGKQVAVLVPTTVLAQQHYNSFRERMAEYPVRIELLSRFRTPKQQRTALAAAAAGTVDILIGTHRIVSPDVEFKNLGLVVVDEEQKFGVKHKEQFKMLRRTVDVLTLSATPIPRTLYLALTGARDLSTLETPPQDRLPVETLVANFDDRLVRDAIQRELNRGGQVYFLHNRVATIEATALRIRDLVPDARVMVGHGQMHDDDLEQVFTRFVNAEADVLVSTTIIESGLDIPNANTIIIDRADRFGLSELYQLRGRVGRYKHQAYCYLLLPRHAQLLTEARKRMSAIKQYSALGSGFKIAMRDLEIRGAGNILGAQQSGHITAVGFELYCQLLGQSVAALKGQPVKARVDVRVSLDFLALNPGEERAQRRETQRGSKPEIQINVPREAYTYSDFEADEIPESKPKEGPRDLGRAPAYLPLDYVREAGQRVEIYRKLAQATEKGALERLTGELKDRFGPLPPPVELVFAVAELRLLAAERQITGVEVVEDKVKLTRRGELVTVGGQFPRLTKREAKARLGELKKLLLSFR